jgi:hypothetical protein
MRILTDIAADVFELVCLAAFLFVTVGWVAGAADHF